MAGAGKNMAAGGSAEDAVSAGLMSSGNPYAMAAGLGLQVVSASDKAKQERANQEAAYKNAANTRRQKAIQDLVMTARGMRL